MARLCESAEANRSVHRWSTTKRLSQSGVDRQPPEVRNKQQDTRSGSRHTCATAVNTSVTQQPVLHGSTSAVVLSQVQATATTAQPIKVPQFVPPPRLMPRPTFQAQVRLRKTRLQPLTLPDPCVAPRGALVTLQQRAGLDQQTLMPCSWH